MYLVSLSILGIFTIRFNGYGILEVKKKEFPTDRPIPEKQGRVRGNKNIFKVGLMRLISSLAPAHPLVWKPQIIVSLEMARRSFLAVS